MRFPSASANFTVLTGLLQCRVCTIFPQAILPCSPSPLGQSEGINLNVYYQHFRYILVVVATINICGPFIFARNTPLILLALLYPESRLLCNPDIVLAISSNYKGWAKSLASSSYLPSLAASAPISTKRRHGSQNITKVWSKSWETLITTKNV